MAKIVEPETLLVVLEGCANGVSLGGIVLLEATLDESIMAEVGV
jgi:hypothetical protein